MPHVDRHAPFRTRRLAGLVLGVVLLGGTARQAFADALPEPARQMVPSSVAEPALSPSPRSIAPESAIQTERAESAKPVERWYGYQIMAADLTSVGLAVFGAQPSVGEIGLVVGPSLIHTVHGRVGMAIGSPMLRLGLPAAGALVGALARSCSSTGQALGSGLGEPAEQDDGCGTNRVLLGAGVGLLVAMVLDWTMAWEPVEGAASVAASPGLHLTSAGLTPNPNGAVLVLGGQF
jgi:hypothetical protein